MPETWVQATVVLALVVPGFVYQVSRQAAAGPDPEQKEFGTRVLRAIVSTAVFAGVYSLLFGTTIVDYVRTPDRALNEVQALGVYFVVFALLIPWATARLHYVLVSSAAFTSVVGGLTSRFGLRRAYDPTPSAWDFAFSRGEASWVRVRFADGTWLGGWFGDASYASSFPNPQELFVEEGWVINRDGTFSDVRHAPGGMIIRCRDAVSVDLIPVEVDTEEPASEQTEGGRIR
jgi:hypothetical protein